MDAGHVGAGGCGVCAAAAMGAFVFGNSFCGDRFDGGGVVLGG